MDPGRVVGTDTLSSEKLIETYVRRVTTHPRWEDFSIQSSDLEDAIRAGAFDAKSLFVWLLGRITGSEPSVRIGEKTPRHEQFISRIIELFPDAKFIHIHRDPRDVILSMSQRPWAKNTSTFAKAHRCLNAYQRTQNLQRRDGCRRIIDVSYERLVTEPENELRRVCDFLDEQFDAAMLRYHERDETGYVQRESEWKALTTKPIDRSRIGRFRGRLSSQEIRVIEHVVGGHLIRLGYEPEPGVPQMSLSLKSRMYIEHAIARCRSLIAHMFAKLSGRSGVE